MKTRYVQVLGNIARCLPDHMQNISTHAIEVPNSEYDKAVHDEYFIVEDGEPRRRTSQEWDEYNAAKEEKAEKSRIANLEQQANAYQDSIMSPNESRAIMGARASGIQLKPKAKANSEWVDSIWAIYESKVLDSSNTQEFSEAGEKPYRFKDLMAEQLEA